MIYHLATFKHCKQKTSNLNENANHICTALVVVVPNWYRGIFSTSPYSKELNNCHS